MRVSQASDKLIDEAGAPCLVGVAGDAALNRFDQHRQSAAPGDGKAVN